MSITSFKSLTMAESCLLSQPSLFYSKTKSPFISNSAKPFKIQNPTYNSSRVSHSLSLTTGNRRTRHSSLLTLVAQTSDWAQQEEKEDGATWENQGEPKWGSETESNEDDGEAGVFEEPREELKIFVGNLPFDVDSEKLAYIFEQTPGTVEIAEVVYNRETDRSRGFGFVTMSTAEEVERAVNKYSGFELDGRVLTVNRAAPKGSPRPERPPRAFESTLRIYVGNLPWEVDHDRLEQLFSEHGKVESARVVYDRETGRSRGFGFVTMTNEAEMNDAIAALDGQTLNGRAMRVNVAEARRSY